VVRGSVRALASTASRLHPFGEYELRHPNLDRWRDLRRALTLRQEARRQQGRFRKDPAAYLAALTRSSAATALLAPEGLGGFWWVVVNRGADGIP
jgi:hypothetical protein